jgi:hypothetical protein
LASRLFWYTVAPILVVLMSSAVSASMASSQNGENQANVGQLLNDTGVFSVKHTQLGVIGVNQTGSRSPCLAWNSTDCVATDGLFAAQWFLLVELQFKAVPKSPATFVVSVQIDSASSSLQPIEFTVASSTMSGSTGDFIWDLGSSFSTPLAFTVTVSNA